jgi:hypothetical protein
MGSLTYEDNQSATLADMHEYVEALERERDSLALALKAIKAYTIDPRAHERASKALATLDAGGRNRPPVDGQGGMTIDKGVGGEDDQ